MDLSCSARAGLGGELELAGSSRTMSILPLSAISCLPHHRGMKTQTFLRIHRKWSEQPRLIRREAGTPRGHSDRCSGTARAPQTGLVTVVLSEPEFPHRLHARREREVARKRSLDWRPVPSTANLAEGRLPESHLLLAARAQVLVSPDERLTLAHRWADLLTHARRSPAAGNPASTDQPGHSLGQANRRFAPFSIAWSAADAWPHPRASPRSAGSSPTGPGLSTTAGPPQSLQGRCGKRPPSLLQQTSDMCAPGPADRVPSPTGRFAGLTMDSESSRTTSTDGCTWNRQVDDPRCCPCLGMAARCSREFPERGDAACRRGLPLLRRKTTELQERPVDEGKCEAPRQSAVP